VFKEFRHYCQRSKGEGGGSLFIVLPVVAVVSLFEDLDLAAADESARLGAADADEGALERVVTLESQIVNEETKEAEAVCHVGSDLGEDYAIGLVVVSGGVGLVGLDGDAVGSEAADHRAHGGRLELGLIRDELVEENLTDFSIGLDVPDEALAEEEGLLVIEGAFSDGGTLAGAKAIEKAATIFLAHGGVSHDGSESDFENGAHCVFLF